MKKIHNDLTIIGGDLDARVYCSCGAQFYMDVPEVPYKCICGALYKGEIQIYQIEEEDREDNFVLLARLIDNLGENAEDTDEVTE